MVNLRERTIAQISLFLDSFFTQQNSFVYWRRALRDKNGSISGLAQNLYRFYKLHGRGLAVLGDSERQQIASDAAVFLSEARRVATFLESDFVGKSFIEFHDRAHWAGIFFNPNAKNGFGHRLYVNVRFNRYYDFFVAFMTSLFRVTQRPFLVGKSLRYDPSENCMKYGDSPRFDFFFRLKFMNPTRTLKKSPLLARDKVVITIPSDNVLVFRTLFRLLTNLDDDLFEDEVPLLCTPLARGIGYGPSMGNLEVGDYNAACSAFEEKVSFGLWITSLLAEIIIRVVRSKRDQIQTLIDKWSLLDHSEKNSLDKAKYYYEGNSSFVGLRQLVALEVMAVVQKDPRFLRHFGKVNLVQRRLTQFRLR